MEEFRNISDVVKELWEARARDLVEKQPGIRQRLIDTPHKYSRITYDGLDNSIRHWCSASTIHQWLMSREGYIIYLVSVIHLLYPIHRRGVFKNWGRGQG